MISFVLGIGTVAVLVTSLMKEVPPTLRLLICWTFSTISSIAASIVFYANGRGMIADFGSVLSGLCGAGIVASAALAIELFAPSKRLRSKNTAEYDREMAENAVNVVMVILVSSSVLAAVLTEQLGASEYSVFGLLPACAISLRQLSYFMHRVKLDTLRTDDVAVKRSLLLKQLSSGKRRL